MRWSILFELMVEVLIALENDCITLCMGTSSPKKWL